MRNCVLVVCSALLLLAGCSRARVTTEIKERGAWTRTVALSGQEKKEGAMTPSEALEDTFVLPSGPEWKTHEEKKSGERTLTFERRLQAGIRIKGDLSIKSEANVVFSNEGSVARLGPGRFEYSEILRWTGPQPKTTDMKAEDLAKLKACLPPALASDENARSLADKTAKLAVPVLFGPGDPLLALGFMHPDLAGRRISQRIGSLLLQALEEQFGDKLTVDQRRQVARHFIETTVAQTMPIKPDANAGPPSNKNSAGLVPIMFILKTPGDIVSSNGEIDELTGEVYWALFPEGAALELVKLTAIVQINPAGPISGQ